MQNNIIGNMDRYAKYLRKSRKDLEAEAHGSGETLKKHEMILEDLSNSLNIKREQIDTFREVVSGDSIASRPVIQELLHLVEQGFYKGVLVVEVERLARGNTLDQGIVANAFQYSNTKIITPMKIYDPCNEYDQEYFEFGLFMSRREYKTINRRLQNGRAVSANQGKFPGSRPPYGYKRKKIDNDKGWTLEIIPEQAETVKKIFDLYAYQNMHPADICRYLDSYNIRPLKSDTWSSSSIRDILSNPVYIGKIRWKDRKVVKVLKDGKIINTQPKNKNDVILVDGLHPSIIDKKTYDIVQLRKKENNTAPIPGIYNIQNPLAGLIKCSKCGRTMFRISPTIIACTNTKCDNISSKLDIVEKKLLKGLEMWLQEYEEEIDDLNIANTNINDIIALKKSTLTQIAKSLTDCNGKLEKIYDFLENGIYTVDVFEERKTKILKEQKELSEKYSKLKEEIQEIEKTEKTKKDLIPQTKNVLKEYSKCTSMKEKNDLLKSVISKVEYLKTEKCYNKNSNPENFELLIYPKF